MSNSYPVQWTRFAVTSEADFVRWEESNIWNLTIVFSLGSVHSNLITSKAQDLHSVTSKYFVTISRRTALRRLHLDGCFVKPDRCCEVVRVDEICSDDFDSICQACKRKMLAECGKDDVVDSSSTPSSSSTDSGEDALEVPVG